MSVILSGAKNPAEATDDGWSSARIALDTAAARDAAGLRHTRLALIG